MLEYISNALTEAPHMRHCMGAFSLAEGRPSGDMAGLPGAGLGLMALILAGLLIYLCRLRRRLADKTRAVQESDDRLLAFGSHLPDLTTFQLIHDPDRKTFHFGFISGQAERVLGLDRAQIMADATLAMDHVYEDDVPRLHEAFSAAIEQPAPVSLEIRLLDSQGTYRWLQVMATPRRSGPQLIWDGLILNISEKKETERALAGEAGNFSNLLKNIDDFMLICDMEDQLLYISPSLSRRLGYSESELSDMSFFELYSSGAHAEIDQLIARLQTETSTSDEHPLQMKSGASLPVEMNLFHGFWKQEKAIFGIARDVARVQQSESALRESRKMLQLIIDSIPMSIFWKDQNSVYLGCNEAFTHECGLDYPEDVVGKKPFDLFAENNATDIIERDQHVLNTNEPRLNHSESHTLPDGSIGWREISVIPMRNELGKAVGVLGIWRDVTEHNRAEERLKRTLDDMERFNQLMRGRERRTLELKDEINALLKELNRPHKYRTTAEELS